PTGALPLVHATGITGRPTRFLADHHLPFVPRVGRDAVLADLGLGELLADHDPAGDRMVWLSRADPGAESALTHRLAASGIKVVGRDSASELQRRYAGNGAVLALRLLLLCGAAAVIVSVGALLVAAYTGRRQRAYEV